MNALCDCVQGYLAHKKQPLPRTLQYPHAQGPMVVQGGGVISYEQGTPVLRGRRSEEVERARECLVRLWIHIYLVARNTCVRGLKPGRARLWMTLEPLLGSTALYRANVSW